MTNTEAHECLYKTVKDGIKAVLDGSKLKFEGYGSIAIAIDILNSLGLEPLGPVETNGWQADFWQIYDKDGEGPEYLLSGSMYYGELNFCLNGDGDE